MASGWITNLTVLREDAVQKHAWPFFSLGDARKVVRHHLALAACLAVSTIIALPASASADPPSAVKARIDTALQNILTLEREGHDGYATFWDGNNISNAAGPKNAVYAAKRLAR